MSTSMKWLVVGLLAFIVIVVIAYNSAVQNATVRTTSEVDLLAETVSVGILRGEVEEGTDDFIHFDKEELVANLVANVAAAQKNHKYDIELEYVFLDTDGNVTEQEENIRGIQFRVQLKDESGKVRGTAERRLALNYPKN